MRLPTPFLPDISPTSQRPCYRTSPPYPYTHNTWLNCRKAGTVLFNDALNTFHLRLCGVRHMVKDHSDSERVNPLPPYELLFPINSKVILYAPSHRQDSTYHGLCYTSRGALAGTRNSSMGPPHEVSIRRPIAPWANALTTELHLAPQLLRSSPYCYGQGTVGAYRDVLFICIITCLVGLCVSSFFSVHNIYIYN